MNYVLEWIVSNFFMGSDVTINSYEIKLTDSFHEFHFFFKKMTSVIWRFFFSYEHPSLQLSYTNLSYDKEILENYQEMISIFWFICNKADEMARSSHSQLLWGNKDCAT